uniref:GMP reductase n=2 Tax=Lygus hesperus TaxID=30085 RepID=A0A0K8SJ03_LYGHE
MHHLKVDPDIKLDFQDVLIRPRRSKLKSRSEVDLFCEYTFKNSKKTCKCIPLVASNMDTIGTFEMAAALSKQGLMTAVHKYYCAEEWKSFAQENPEALNFVTISSGTSEDDIKRLSGILHEVPGIFGVTLDIANGYQDSFPDTISRVRDEFPNHAIVAGNVVTGELVEDLIRAGADIVKVGVGPGSVCITRIKTGVGYPQLSVVLECGEVAHEIGGHLMADGGCTCPGDIAKAIGGGADFVMMGGMLAGHDQSGGELRTKEDGTKVKTFYGMSSETAMSKHVGQVASYRTAEGKCVEVPYRGDVNETLQDILGGLRSTCTYTGSPSLSQLASRTTFIRVQHQANYFYGTKH